MELVQFDISLARSIMERRRNGAEDFSLGSRVYQSTNERLYEYRYLFEAKRKMLSVIASGDQIFNAILAGVESIDAFDISKFPKYFLYLKKAALEGLTEDEYYDFFYVEPKETYEVINSKYRNLYEKKIMPHLSGDALIFWNYLFSRYNWGLICQGLYQTYQFGGREIIKNNKFLDPKYYQELKSRLKDVQINCQIGNIVDLAPNYLSAYDLIYLSNIYSYIDNSTLTRLVKTLNLTPDGVMIFAGGPRTPITDENIIAMNDSVRYRFTKKDSYAVGRIA